MGGIRLSVQQIEQILYLSGVLHKSERFIAKTLGVGKTSVHRVVAESKLKPIQQPMQSKVQVQKAEIENDNGFEKDERVWEPAIIDVGSRPSPLNAYRGRAGTKSSYSPQPFEQLYATAEDTMLRVLEDIPGIPPHEIEMYLNLFRLDVQGYIMDRGRLARSLSDGFGSVAGAAAFHEFMRFRQRLIGMRAVEYSRLRLIVHPGESTTFSPQMRR